MAAVGGASLPPTDVGRPYPTDPLWRGSDTRLFDAASKLLAEAPQLTAYFPRADSRDFFFWIVNHGLREYPERLGAFLPPLPDRRVQRLILNGWKLDAFLNVGAEASRRYLELLESAGADPFRARSFLDFGCGCGRVLRHLAPLSRATDLWGCDIEPEAIDYCRRELGFARFHLNTSTPPLPVADGSFDRVLSVSVFTHLGERSRREWLDELRRVVEPGGLLALSTHGERAWQRVVSDADLRRSMEISDQSVEEASAVWNSEGIAFLPHLVPRSHRHEDAYGLVFVRRERIDAFFRGFEVVRLHAAALGDWQDFALLRRT